MNRHNLTGRAVVLLIASAALTRPSAAQTVQTQSPGAQVPERQAPAWLVGAPLLSPFKAVRWHGSTPQVLVGNAWYELIAINDLPADRIVSSAKADDPDWQRHFEENLVALLRHVGEDPGDSVTLSVRDLQSQQMLTLAHVALTEANEQLIARAWKEMEEIRACLGANDDQWQVLQPRVEKVKELRLLNLALTVDIGRSPDLHTDDLDIALPGEFIATNNALQGGARSPGRDLQARLDDYRAVRNQARKELEEAEKELKELLTVEQEARMVLQDYLD